MVTLFLLLILATPVSSLNRSTFATVGYLPEWRYEGANWETLSTHLTHLLLFSAEPLPDGQITGLDRFPREELLKQARAAATAHGTKLMLCFGGNGRSSGFSAMVRSKASRQRFVTASKALISRMSGDGIDLNWEYPGYQFGKGYDSDAELEKDYRGLALLAKELKKVMPTKELTLAYYPDGRQESLLLKHGLADTVDLMHAMTYDQNGGHHSSLDFALKSMDLAASSGLPIHKVTLGLPFYGRSSTTGDWTTYEDLVQRHHPLDPALDSVAAPPAPSGGGARGGETIGFNGRATIAEKTAAAIRRGFGGVMIWEAGQDCRMVAVTHGDKTHGVTCPEGEKSSLLVAMSDAIRGEGKDGVEGNDVKKTNKKSEL